MFRRCRAFAGYEIQCFARISQPLTRDIRDINEIALFTAQDVSAHEAVPHSKLADFYLAAPLKIEQSGRLRRIIAETSSPVEPSKYDDLQIHARRKGFG